MFGVGLGEIFVIFLVAFLVFGPDKLPTVVRSLAKIMGQLRGFQNELRYSLMQVDETLKKSVNEGTVSQTPSVQPPPIVIDAEKAPPPQEQIHG